MVVLSSAIFFSAVPAYLKSLLIIFIIGIIAFIAGKFIGYKTKEEIKAGKKYIHLFLACLIAVSFVFLLMFFYINSSSWFFALMLVLLPVLGGAAFYFQAASFYHGIALGILHEFFLIPSIFLLSTAVEGSLNRNYVRLLFGFILGAVVGLAVRYFFFVYGIVNVIV